MNIYKHTLALIGLGCILCGQGKTHADEIWHGAKWIGGDDNSRMFYSQYVPVFQLSFDLQLDNADTRAGIIYGANDLRLLDAEKNIYRVANLPDSSFVKIQFGTDSLRVFRQGYTAGDNGAKAMYGFPMPAAIDLSRHNHVTIKSSCGITTVLVDSTQIARFNISPTPGGGDYIAYPVVGDIGYDVRDGKARIENFEVQNLRSPHNALARCDFGTAHGFKIISLPQIGATSLRSTIDINPNRTLCQATLRITARGIYDACINVQLIAPDSYLNPGASQYNKSHYYQDFDVTGLLDRGKNELSVTLAEGWWSGAVSFEPANWNWFGDRQSMLCCLDVVYDDGTTQHFISDPESWQATTDGPVRYGSLFQGEVHDATRSLSDATWKPATEVPLAGVVSDVATAGWPLANDYSQFTLIPDNRAGVSMFDEVTAVECRRLSAGEYVYDMGINHAGVPAITFGGLKKGQKITLRYVEVLYPDNRQYAPNIGKPMVENLRAAMCQDIYIASGKPVETFEPRTTYHGYRFIEISGLDNPLPLASVKSRILSSVDKFTSGFECSDTLINKLVANVRRSTLSNVFSIPTDCPQRNERMGWSGDVSVFAPAMSYLFDARNFLTRHNRALRDTQEPDGAYAPIAPMGGGFGGPLWQSAGIVLPWQLYVQYGDTAALAANYDAMKDYIKMVASEYIDSARHYYHGTGTWVDLGDWLGPQCNQNEEPLLFDSYYIYELGIMERAARILGHNDDAALFADMRARRIAFVNDAYVDNERKAIVARGFGSQHIGWAGAEGGQPDGKVIDAHSTYAVPLALGVFDSGTQSMMAARLSRLVGNESVGDDGKTYPPHSLMTGFVGTPWILYALADNGYAADAYSILLTKTYPSWLYPVGLGATTVWERLNSMTEEDGFGANNSMNSFNHYAFGCVYDWLMQRCVGINPDADAPGFKHIVLKPVADPTGHLKYAKGWYDSANGRIESQWQRDGDSVTYTFVIPDGTTATASLPDGEHRLAPGRHTFRL